MVTILVNNYRVTIMGVVCNPRPGSFTHALAKHAKETLEGLGHELLLHDLYQERFDPVLDASELARSFSLDGLVQTYCRELSSSAGLVVLHPDWWGQPPAVLKGWFDRVWAPGSAYDHATDLGAIRPRLHGLRRTLAITTLGAPGWVDWLVMHQPVRRVLKTAILGTCAPKSRFEMLSLYKSERVEPARFESFRRRIAACLADWR